ncbi:hypothetical protein ASC97_09045 [Rhizobium sp. Root1203]|uniref:phosphatase PAP2 family protein n=1 Tax=Rhizobium sp. Root1203 TaxID=1736427 RepID=UPI000708E526|nr:phosphatase PAP2 family protein [Rhizobium sp. Root1203]KQV28596.1 hypothetical protein ASC97_09045 [Rhizobium sp. Root1203]
MFKERGMAVKAMRWLAELVSHVWARMLADRWLYVAIASYCIVGFAVVVASGHGRTMAYGLYFAQWTLLFLLFMPIVAIVIDCFRTILRFNQKRPLALRRVLSPQRLAHVIAGMALLMALMIFQGTFTSIKNVLPVMRGGFLYDRLLADVDARLAFGTDPWRLLHVFAKGHILFEIVDWNYGVLWFYVCFIALFYVVTSPRAASVRVRYVSMFMLVWFVCGNILAGALISAGPAFYGAVTGDRDRFGDQLAALASGEWASKAALFQRYLWSLYESGATGLGSSISAFPSVHVGLIALNAFFAAEVSRLLGVVAFAYVAFVMASSVYLGWHFAIDGYTSVIVTALMHYGLRWLMCPAPNAETKRAMSAAEA